MNFIINKDEYLQAKKAWTQPGYHHDAADHIIYNALRGHNLDRGFSPITTANKLQNGNEAMQSFNVAKFNATWSMRSSQPWAGEQPDRADRRIKADAERLKNLTIKFGVEFTPALIATLRELLK